MQKAVLTITAIFPAIIFSACSFSEPLSCSSDGVKVTTIELMTDQIRDQEANIYLTQTPGAGRLLLHSDVATKKMLVTGDIGYQDIVNANNGPKVQAILDKIDAIMDGYQVSMQNIRTTAVDEAVDSVNCEAEAVLSNPERTATVPIVYKAQVTDDEGIYVSMDRLF